MKMFSTLSLLPHEPYQPNYHTPQIPSPLSSSPLRLSPNSPRNGNVPRLQQYSMSSPTPLLRRKDPPFSKRVTRANPLIHSRDDGRETRRKLFLKKVRKGSEDKKWDARGGDDEMMRSIWIAEQKRRADRQARDASSIPAPYEEEFLEMDEKQYSQSTTTLRTDEEKADEVAQQEEEEIEAFLSMLETPRKYGPYEPHNNLETPYGSDDEDYDHIFQDVINMEEMGFGDKSTKSKDTFESDHEMMDTS